MCNFVLLIAEVTLAFVERGLWGAWEEWEEGEREEKVGGAEEEEPWLANPYHDGLSYLGKVASSPFLCEEKGG